MTAPLGLWIGNVLSINGGRTSISIPTLRGTPYEKVRFLLPVGSPDAAVGAGSISVGDDSLALRPLQVGDQVLVGLIQGSRDRPVILGRLS